MNSFFETSKKARKKRRGFFVRTVRVLVELSPYDLSRGRIVYRLK